MKIAHARAVDFMTIAASDLRTAALDITYPTRPTERLAEWPAWMSGKSAKPANKQSRMPVHTITIGKLNVQYFAGFGASNLTVKWDGRARIKLAITL